MDQSAVSAEHWSPLGHGASALSLSQALPDEQAQEASSLQTEDAPDGQAQSSLAEPRSPLRALSSNSPTRPRSQSKQAAAHAVGRTSQHASLQSSQPVVDQPAQEIHRADDDDASAATLILGAAPLQEQQSPLPSNALVAYSSDEDDWHNAVDATESRLQV